MTVTGAQCACRPLTVTTENAECWVRRVEAATWRLVNRSHAAHIHPQPRNQINGLLVFLISFPSVAQLSFLSLVLNVTAPDYFGEPLCGCGGVAESDEE